MYALSLSLSISLLAALVCNELIKGFRILYKKMKGKTVNSDYLITLGAALVFGFVLYKFKNIVPALIASIIVVILPAQIYYWRQKSIKMETLKQLATAAQLFTNEYDLSHSIPKSLNIVSQRIPAPVGVVFRKAYSNLAIGVPHDKVFNTMAKDLKSDFGIIFVQLLRAMYNQGEIILPLMSSLVTKIRVAQEQENLKQTETTGDRKFNIFLLFLPIAIFIWMQRAVPQINTFLADTLAGRILFTLWLVSIVIWFFIDRIVSEY